MRRKKLLCPEVFFLFNKIIICFHIHYSSLYYLWLIKSHQSQKAILWLCDLRIRVYFFVFFAFMSGLTLGYWLLVVETNLDGVFCAPVG